MIISILTKLYLQIPLLLAVVLIGVAPLHAGEFRYNGATNSIEMKGTIRVGDGARFSDLLRAHPQTERVELRGSVGGEYTSALDISMEVKRRGLQTVSSDYCHSACAYIWLAGAAPTVVGSESPKIHLPYLDATGEALPDLTYDWLEALGLPSTFADAVVRSVGPANDFVRLTPEFLTRFGAFRRQAA